LNKSCARENRTEVETIGERLKAKSGKDEGVSPVSVQCVGRATVGATLEARRPAEGSGGDDGTASDDGDAGHPQ